MDRFNGKKLLNRPVIDGIKKPQELIEETLKGQGQVFTLLVKPTPKPVKVKRLPAAPFGIAFIKTS